MAHKHSIYDADPHFTIDHVTRAIVNETGKTILMQYDHDSERFSFEINRLVEGHDVTQCNKIEIHYANADGNRQGVNYGVYEVNDAMVDPANPDRVVFTWLVSQNATMYAGSLSFIIVFTCVEAGEVVYRWNTNINTSVSIAVGMNNGEMIEEQYPDILTQWKDQLFAAATGTNSVMVGPIEPENYPYIWFDTSEYLGTSEKNVGYLTIKAADGIKQRLYPVVKMESIDGLERLKFEFDKSLQQLELQFLNHENTSSFQFMNMDSKIDKLEESITGAQTAIAHSLTAKGVSVPDNMSIKDVAGLIDIIEMDVPTELRGVIVTNPPNKTEYYPSQSFDPTGMVVSADFGDGVTVPVECYTVTPDVFSEGDTHVTISLAVNGITKTTTYPVDVNLDVAEAVPAGSIIYVAESELSNTAYIVVDTNYHDKVLLLRKECLPNTVKYYTSKPYDTGSHKYEGSNLDKYLNVTFYETLPSETAAAIQEVSVPVRGNATSDATQDYLDRNIFALSAKEWGYDTSPLEGEAIEYTECMTASVNYWTREPNGGMNNWAYAVTNLGGCSGSACTTGLHVRPAFCISKKQGLKKTDDGWVITDSPTEDLFATWSVDSEGNATLTGVSFDVDDEGNATIG